MSHPVDLIIATALHSVAERIEGLPEPLRTLTLGDRQLPAELARSLGVRLVATGHIETVLAMLAAAGGPGSLDEVYHRWQAVLDARSAEAKRHGEAATPNGQP